jgi:hypothetical protein
MRFGHPARTTRAPKRDTLQSMRRFGQIDIAEVHESAQTNWDTEIARIAAAQYGVITARQLMAVGLGRAAITARRRRGYLIDLFRGVYAVAYKPVTPHGTWMAATLACGQGAVLSHAAAAALWGIRPSASAKIDVTVPGRAGRTRPDLRVHRAGALLPNQITEHAGIPCTTVGRTIIDLAAGHPQNTVEYAIHQAETLRIFNRDEVVAALDAAPSRPGSATVRRILGLSLPKEDRIKGKLARMLSKLCREAGLPEPLVDHWIDVPDADGFEVDFCWPQLGLIIEADGRAFHDTHRGFENDRHRDRVLRLAGWRVERFTWRQVVERPDEVARQLRLILASIRRSLPSPVQ